MPKIKRNGHYETITDAILGNSHCSETELLDPTLEDARCIENMYKAAAYIVQAIKNNTPVTLIGDYDSDGLNASAILVKLFRYFGKEINVIIPRRISDGYGFSMKHVQNIQPGLVMTVDNGIAAVEPMAYLRKAGKYYTIVMDHHLPGPVLPDADLIIDPHVAPEKNGFRYYCGAGLAYQLSRLLLEKQTGEKAQALRDELLVHAAIATISDSMPLVGGNRRIVMDGLWVMNEKKTALSAGLQALLAAAPEGKIDEKTIGFTYAPIVNAPARMYDAGGESTMKLLTSTDSGEAAVYMAKMLTINQSRKQTVNKITVSIQAYLDNNPDVATKRPLVVYYPGIPEGIIGIIAGQLAEQYQKETVVFSDAKGDSSILKGSGRASANGDMIPIMEAVRGASTACGGHAGAMGVSIKKDNLARVTNMMYAAVPQTIQDRVLVWDLPLMEHQVVQAYQEQSNFGPFGEGCPKPVFYLRGVHAVSEGGSYFRLLGTDQSTLKLTGNGFECLGFGMGKKFQELGKPAVVDIIGRLSQNTFRGRTTPQVEIIDFCTSQG